MLCGTMRSSNKKARSGRSSKRDPAVLDALQALGGEPKDLSPHDAVYVRYCLPATGAVGAAWLAWLNTGEMRIRKSLLRSISAFVNFM